MFRKSRRDDMIIEHELIIFSKPRRGDILSNKQSIILIVMSLLRSFDKDFNCGYNHVIPSGFKNLCIGILCHISSEIH